MMKKMVKKKKECKSKTAKKVKMMNLKTLMRKKKKKITLFKKSEKFSLSL